MCEEHAVYHSTRQYTSPSVAPKHDHRVPPQKKEKKCVLHLVDFSKNALSGTVRVPEQVYRKGDRSFRFGGNMDLTVERL